MGQGQSTAEDVNETDQAQSDYYDLLGLDRQATDEEIKKAYRRKALELHPDRNYGNVEDATKLFAEIQTAYEVLSDAQERAWYDSHRDVLLRGGNDPATGAHEYSYNIRMTTTEEVLKLMMRFNGKLDYSDAPSGFYGGLQDFFGKLAKEESVACRWEEEEPVEYPDFGHKEDDYEDIVRPFYAAWNGFATRKSYAWKDHYRLSDAPDRRIRRLMEKENKKIREEAVQEFNDAVRSLLAFVRKRDPRFQDNQKSEAERQKALRDLAVAQAERARAARQARLAELDRMSVPDWAQSRAKDEHEGDFSSESEAEDHEFECVVCDKIFKSEAQFQTHEKSKKHLKLVKQLKRDMRDENVQLDAQDGSGDVAEDVDVAHELQSSPIGFISAAEQPAKAHDIETELANESTSDVESSLPRVKSDDDVQEKIPTSEQSDDDYAPRSEVVVRLAGTTLENTPAASESDVTESSAQPKIGKAKQKRAKKAAQQSSGDHAAPGAHIKCAVCQSCFASKTKLFDHIKLKGHAAPPTQVKSGGGKATKGKKK